MHLLYHWAVSGVWLVIFIAKVFGESTEVIDLIDELNCKGDALCGPIAVNCSYNGGGLLGWR